MRQLDLFSAVQSSTEGIDTEFKSARGGMPGSFCDWSTRDSPLHLVLLSLVFIRVWRRNDWH